MRRVGRGFTLVELLVVIAIIGVLSSVVLASLSTARDKANYALVVQDLHSANIAFFLLLSDRGCWPREGSTECGGYSGANPSIATLIGSSSFGLSRYLPAAPHWPFSSEVWSYDNDGSSWSPATCATDPDTVVDNGVNLFVINVTEEQYEKFDKLLDGDSDPSTKAAKQCGQIRLKANNTLFYTLSESGR